MPLDDTPEQQLRQIADLERLNNNLNAIGEAIQQLTAENKRIRNLKEPLDIYSSNPEVLKEALKLLSPAELESLKSNLKISVTNSKSSYVITNIANIINDKSIPSSATSEVLQAELQNLLNDNISDFEHRKAEYDELMVKVKGLMLINPLSLIKFGKARQLAELFNVSASSMISLVSKFMIQELKETTQPKIKTRKGKIDFPRTIRASMQFEGTPYELKRRSKAIRIRQIKPRIYFIIDTSGSQASGIYISTALVYALAQVLKDYDIILYSASRWDHDKKGIELLQEAEKRNLSDYVVPREVTSRLTKKDIISYSKNLNSLYNRIITPNSGASDDTYYIFKSIAHLVPDDSIFITFGDDDQLTDGSHTFIDSLVTPKNRIYIKRFKGKLFSFNTLRAWDSWGNIEPTNFNFRPPNPKDFNIDDIVFYPRKVPDNYTYGDWVKNIIKVISSFVDSTR